MRTTEIGAWTPASGITPGIRRPVRTITLPSISSRRIRFGEPTSFRVSGVIVAAFRPSPCSRTAAAASETTRVLGRAPVLEREVEADELELDADHIGRQRAQCLLEQLLSGLVPFEDGDRGGGHARDYSRRPAGKDAITVARKGGWRREGRRQFRYLDSRGKRITDPAKLERIESLAIPPAWKDVWISPRAEREAAGDRSRFRRAAPVPLSPRIPRAAGAGEIRQADPLRGAASRASRGRCPSTWKRIRATANASARSPFA